MKPQLESNPNTARALSFHTTTAADAVKATAVSALRTSIDRILGLMRDCEDPAHKKRLNDTLFLATQALSAAVRAESRLPTGR